MAFDPKWTKSWTLEELKRIASLNGFHVNVLKINGTINPFQGLQDTSKQESTKTVQKIIQTSKPTIHVILRVPKSQHPITIGQVLSCEVESRVVEVVCDPFFKIQPSKKPTSMTKRDEKRVAVSQSSYPTSHSSYPTSHSSYPTSHSSYPTSHSSYPTSHSSYPTSHSSYPTSHPTPKQTTLLEWLRKKKVQYDKTVQTGTNAHADSSENQIA